MNNILEYLKLHEYNKNIYKEVDENGLICSIKEGIFKLFDNLNELHVEIDSLKDTKDKLYTDYTYLINNNNNIENEYIKIINNKRKRNENENDDNICEICVELDKNILLNCSHKFCGVCLIKNKNNKCPMCRTEITSKTDIS